MPERKARSSDKSTVNFMKPITNIMVFGGPDDPCFGKHYSPEAKECGRCGDNELCMIAKAQLAKARVTKVESKHPFKDKEEVDIHIQNAIKNQVITNGISSFIQVVKHIRTKFQFKDLLDAKEATKKAALKIKTLKLIKTDGKRRFKVI